MKTALAAAALLVAIALTGCAAEAAPDTARVAEGSEATEPAAPIPAESSGPAAEEESPYGDYTQDEFFLASLEGTWQGSNVPSDDQYLSAGSLACEQLAAGTARDSVRVVEGTGPEADSNNANVVQYAVQVYCPEFS